MHSTPDRPQHKSLQSNSRASDSTGSFQSLQKVVRLPGAVMLGLGSMVGTGLFVSIGLAAGIAGSGMLIALTLAAIVAACNGMSSAWLASAHPVSGGTYEYGYRYLNPYFGFTAGWTFLVAKSASAATAALAATAYLFQTFPGIPEPPLDFYYLSFPVLWIAVGITALISLLLLAGLRRSNILNIVLVSITGLSLLLFIAIGIPEVNTESLHIAIVPIDPDLADHSPVSLLLQATALLFVAFTGYGRVATLGEEMIDPERTVPRAVVITIIITFLLYLAVSVILIGTLNLGYLDNVMQRTGTPLRILTDAMELPFASGVIAVGAVTAMLGVLLNLLLGLSRVLMAMGRRGDVSPFFARLNRSGTTPVPAVLTVGLIIMGLTLIGDMMTTWSISAFAVLIYYSITNLAALRLHQNQPIRRAISLLGLIGCAGLAWWVEPKVWMTGVVVVACGLLWKYSRDKMRLSTAEYRS